jgi:hypothetical protein
LVMGMARDGSLPVALAAETQRLLEASTFVYRDGAGVFRMAPVVRKALLAGG